MTTDRPTSEEIPASGKFHPGSRMAFIAPKEHEMIPVLRREVHEFADAVLRIARNPVEGAAAWAYTWLGVGIASALALLGLLGVSGNDVRPGVIAAHVAMCVGALFLAAFMGWVNRKIKGAQTADAEDLAARLRALDKRAPLRSSNMPTEEGSETRPNLAARSAREDVP